MRSKKICLLAAMFIYFASSPFSVFAMNPSNDSVSRVLRSKAYEQFKRRPMSDRSKLLYLIEHFQSENIEVLYDGYYYKAPFAAAIAKYFLINFYKNQTVPVWILKWCNVSIGGHLIYVKYPDGSFRLSRDVLSDQWKLLEQAILSNNSMPNATYAAQSQAQ